MSMHTLPILYINLGAEMLYVLQQRLKAQKVSKDKQSKVVQDIVGHMLSDRVLSTLFTPQPLASSRRLKTNFTKLAHGSIMKLNPDAMEKLYDLMLMALKYQVMLCKSGNELLLLTLNHMDGLRRLVHKSHDHVEIINTACVKFTEHYNKFSEAQLVLIKHTLLTFFQDYHKKVSIFLTHKIQLHNGRFVLPYGGKVPFGSRLPGTIQYKYGDQNTELVTLSCEYVSVEEQGSLDVTGDRVITLGENLYYPVEYSDGSTSSPKNDTGLKKDDKIRKVISDSTATAELDFLQQFLIGFQQHSSDIGFKLSLFDDIETTTTSKPKNAINITKATGGQIKKIIKDFDIEETTPTSIGDDDLLSLMDAL